ncbi:arsenic resistance protein [Geomicrobium sediminis]|uniref:ACR3 family arsenite efflux pump ArsB n=1 Tax=Geomicrobium sediminis TaxID=1347788 RepID=A0ABS2PCC3_9BACL|nr:arsenic resistance protein [Geomicrobium sediminis]MBM7633078.1 ACR3 family arsenite efflux pump ArsB [Geomicrobium sediminis]
MNVIEKYQSLLIILAIGLGLLLGQIAMVERHAELFILPLLIAMLYGLFLSLPIKGFLSAFQHRKFLGSSVFLNFVWTPILAWSLGALFLADHPALWLGFILLLVTPCTDWYLIFTSIAKGNVQLSTSVLPINLLLQVILLPLYLVIFAGTMEMVHLPTLFESVFFVLFLPFILAIFTRFIFRNKTNLLQSKILPFFSTAQLVFLCLAIVAMFASQGTYLMNNLEVLWLLLLPLLLFFLINFFISLLTGKILRFRYEDTASLNLTIIARNSPVALAIVLAAFPEQPLIALALIIGPLIELPVLAIISQALLKRRKNHLGL